MLRRLTILMVFLALLVGVLSCTSIPKTDDDVPRITAEELKVELDAGTVTIVDVRSLNSYEVLHLPEALSIPEAEVRSRTGELPKDGLIVTYCT